MTVIKLDSHGPVIFRQDIKILLRTIAYVFARRGM